MRRMYSENQIKKIVNDGIQQDEIQIGVNPKLILEGLKGSHSEFDVVSKFKVGKLYLFNFNTDSYSAISFIGFCVSNDGDIVTINTCGHLYDANGDLQFVCYFSISNEETLAYNDDGGITIFSGDSYDIYEL